MTPRQQIIELLAQNIPTSQIAAAVGCTDSYVSQLRSDPEIQTELAKLGVEATAKDVAFDKTLERAEELALSKIEKNLPFANMQQALAAFKILNGARKRKDAFTQIDMGATTINVNLTLPAHAIPKYTINAKAEIIEVEGQTMLSATAKSLDNILLSRAAQTAEALNLPAITTLERAASMLGGLTQPKQSKVPARRLPNNLSADVL